MITCRSLGLPIPSALNITRNTNDQPMALIKVRFNCLLFSLFLLTIINAKM